MRSTFHGVRIAIIALACYWTLLTISTHLPVTVLRAVQETTRWSDKLLHFGAFTVLAFLLAWAVPTNPKRRSQNVLVATGIGVAYAAIDELTQIPVGRTADWGDFSADLFGILAGIIVYVAMRELIRVTPFRLEP
ncbi:MAG: VanZ family protein [Pirellula sp.]|nr:VanZ family protein [Pirellula sp.]